MSRNWEDQLREWAKPPGKTERDRCDNAASAIRNAIKASDKLRIRGISIFSQGSYRNNTNVRKSSDVDIGILCTDTFFYDQLPAGLTKENLEFSDATYQYKQYKDEVGEALVNYFGRSAVKRGDKAFDVHETSYHVEADVAAFFEHRRYSADFSHAKGVELQTDKGVRITNWPEQHYDNGVRKNNATGTRFKSIVRVLKSLSVEMTEQGVVAANVPGFFLECLAYNIPDTFFGNSTYLADVKGALGYIYEKTGTEEESAKWVEVSGLKWLFGKTQKWTRDQAKAFTHAAWNHDGLGG